MPTADRRRTLVTLGALVSLLAVAMALGASYGAVRIPLRDVATTMLRSLGLPIQSDITPVQDRILTGLRFPRVLTAALAGSLLGLAATIQQGTLRSRHAAPVTTGASAGGLLGAAFALLLFDGPGLVTAGLGAAAHLPGRIVLAALGAWAAQAFVVHHVIVAGRVQTAPLLLGGLAVSAFVGALGSLMLFLGATGNQTAAAVLISWAFGGLLAQAGPATVGPLLAVLVLTLLATAPLYRTLDILALGEETAATSGVDVTKTRHIGIAATGVAVGAAVATTGIVAFVGLAAAHAGRHLVGPRHHLATPTAALIGATSLVLADLLGRILAAPGELPVGVITATLGAPVLFLLLRSVLRGMPT